MRDGEKSCSETHFSFWSPGLVALPPWTTLLAGLLALKSDATVSFFRPALDAALSAGAAGSAGFALKAALISCGLNWGLIYIFSLISEGIDRDAVNWPNRQLTFLFGRGDREDGLCLRDTY